MRPANSVQQRADRLADRRVILLDEPTRPPSAEELWARTWFAVHVWPGQERLARDGLKDAGFSTFLPVRTFWNASRFRVRRQLERPLLTAYLFVGVDLGGVRRLANDDWSRIANIDGVIAALGDASGPLRVPIENLVQLAGELVAGDYDETRSTFDAGQTVSIEAGPFQGFSGVVIADVSSEAAPDDAIALMVRIMGRETITHIPLADLRLKE